MNSWPKYSKEEISAVSNVLESGKVNYWTGENCKKFESEFANYCNTKFAVSLMNGSVALEAALRSIDIKNEDEVIVTSRTFIASVSAIINVGAVPIFVDIDEDSQNISPELINSKVSVKTKAIICVHLAGWPCEMETIMEISKNLNLYVIEDCSQAHGAKYKGASVGSIGDIGCWSFCQDKIISTGGEGGMITTNNEKIWEKIWSYKDHGKSYHKLSKKQNQQDFRWLHDEFGSNYRMTEMQAVIGRIQLRKLDKWNVERNRYSQTIWKFANEISGLRVPKIPQEINHGCYRCYVFVRPELFKKNWDRSRVIVELNSKGVLCNSGSCSEVYLEKAFNNKDYKPIERLRVAKKLGETSIAFFVHPGLTAQYIDRLCKNLILIMSKAV
jgi:dTDP-4-amino-4,6-dideoxygalactose transaminase